MANPKHLEWLNLNSRRNYPFKEDVSLKDTTDSYLLPQDFIVDLVLVITLGGGVLVSTRFYVKQVTVFGGVATVQIYDDSNILAVTFTVVEGTHTRYQSYPVQGFGVYENAQGKATVGSAAELFNGPEGRFEFEFAAATLEDSVILPSIRGVTSLTKFTEFANQPLLDGHVRLEAGANVRLTVDPVKNALRIDAIAGEGLGPECDCPEPDPFGGAPGPLLTVNGIPPNEEFDFRIEGIGQIKVEPIDNGIRILNTGESLCCDCEEIDVLLERIATVGDKIAEIQCILQQSSLTLPTVNFFEVCLADVIEVSDPSLLTLIT